MISYRFDTDEDLFYVKRHEIVTFDDIMKNINELDSKYHHKKRLYLLTDAREAMTKYSMDDFPLFIQELKKRIHLYHEVKEAVVVDSPLATAYSAFFSELSSSIPNYSYKVFSTIEGAKSWLLYCQKQVAILN